MSSKVIFLSSKAFSRRKIIANRVSYETWQLQRGKNGEGGQWAFVGGENLPTSSDVIARPSELIEPLQVTIAELHILELNCQIRDMIGYMGRQWLWVWPVNNLSRHFKIVIS